MKNIKKTLASIIILILSVTVVLCYFGTNSLFASDAEVKITVEDGQSAYSVIHMLKQSGVIKSEFFMKMHFKKAAAKNGFSIKSGTAMLSPKMSYGEILETLNSSMKTADFVLTVPEGYEAVQIADLVQQVCGIPREEFLAEAANGNFGYDFITDALPQGETRLEGYLFPETYFVAKGSTAHDIIDQMLHQFAAVYTDEYKTRAKELNYSTHQIITLASIIEKECSVDRDIVSSVFHNRLNSPKFSYLESCATVIYVTKSPKDRLTIADTKVKSPYNTYINKGLPPGAICSPGREAIHAALYPASTDYYYFSADGSGKNTFSKTFDEHLAKKGGDSDD